MNINRCLTRLLLLLLLNILSAVSHAQANDNLIPMAAWIHDPVIDSVDVSPDGNHLVALTVSKVDEVPEITVWETKDLSKPPVKFKPNDVKSLVVRWVSNDKLLVLGRQKFDYRIGASHRRWFNDKFYIVDTEGKRYREILRSKDKTSVRFISRLPLEEDHVLVEVGDLEFARDLYKINVNNFSSERVFRGSPVKNSLIDFSGHVYGYSESAGSGDQTRIEYYLENPVTKKIESHLQFYANKRSGIIPLSLAKDKKTLYVSDNSETDKAVIKKYDIVTKELSEPVFGGGYIEALGVSLSNHPKDLGSVISYVGYYDKRYVEYVDPMRKKIYENLKTALPDEESQDIVSMSDDLTVMVVESYSDKEAGAFYLLINGSQLVPLGRKYPYIKPEQLADMKFVTYPARDGLIIPAYLTLPNSGKKPFPTIIMPHGGPWARDYFGFDQWVQFLANRGYAVLQPQYRGSDGWGLKLWKAGDNEWGQKMQDDKDDGAAWLVKEGIAAKDRIAIYGYSYGGYAAMAAAVRPNSPYQCAISGAGLSELRTFDKITFEGQFNREFQNPTVSGLSPLDHVKKANIPIYIFHGDRDQRVPVDQSRKFYDALKGEGKTVEYNEIPDLWHSLPWWPTHHVNVLGSIEDYLANKCGPGGL